MGDRGDRLYTLVEAYAALGDHRTGTAVDDATRAWLAGELRARGATVEEVPFGFVRFDADVELEAGGKPVEAMALAYAGTVELRGVTPTVVELTLAGGYVPIGLDDLLEAAAARESTVVATHGPGGRLVALNRDPSRPCPGAVVLVGGRDLERVRGGCRLSISPRCEPARSATVVGRFGRSGPAAGDTGPVVVTTPLTGWFRCAGERGTGIAVALELCAQLGVRRDVLFVGTTGHELEHLGARHWLAHHCLQPAAVLHLGASVAAGDGTQLSDLRAAFTTSAADVDALAERLAAGKLGVSTGPATWPGEGEEWRRLGAPVLSVLGAFERVHTRDDVPEQVTGPELLDAVAASLLDATSVLV